MKSDQSDGLKTLNVRLSRQATIAVLGKYMIYQKLLGPRTDIGLTQFTRNFVRSLQHIFSDNVKITCRLARTNHHD